ncbi:Carbonic anhydrase-related protein 10 [Eumeta japonica]|uniref:Carbonic anhydrase-related protein 10 n=1 Tax=Eumeta variegata TaxID=151549 RepID=A0A4C1VUP9_EUMVA|nr:Carbonic anhydrase-related protein 10 [Eumeta japonica]
MAKWAKTLPFEPGGIGYDPDQEQIDQWVFKLSQFEPPDACLGEHVEPSVAAVVISPTTTAAISPDPHYPGLSFIVLNTTDSRPHPLHKFHIKYAVFLVKPVFGPNPTPFGSKATLATTEPRKLSRINVGTTYCSSTAPPAGPSFWGLINPQWSMCNKGRRQSPVNIDPEKLLFDPWLRDVQLDKHKGGGGGAGGGDYAALGVTRVMLCKCMRRR